MDEDQDFELIRRSLEGEPRAFETVIEKYQRMVLNLAYRIVNNSEDAKDIAQAVLIKAYGNLV
jgi:RNA polymerase sigma-70 factor (ECF subfamily)